MERHIKPVVVNFPPPVTDGQQEWERRLANQLQPYLPEDQSEAQEVLAIMAEVIKKRSSGDWPRARQAAYILSMFPDDRRAAQRLVSLLSCPFGEHGA